MVIPKATEEWMLKENLNASQIKLNKEQMNEITKIDKNHRLTKGQVFSWYKDQPWQELWDYE